MSMNTVTATPDPKPGDVPIVCCDCGETFVHDIGEQVYFRSHRLLPPKRCPLCRKWKTFEEKHRNLEGNR